MIGLIAVLITALIIGFVTINKTGFKNFKDSEQKIYKDKNQIDDQIEGLKSDISNIEKKMEEKQSTD
jgi:hypothetical protein|tara:strand:+ start:697 stop:897 length:201 start_codon:yes stop_codon:yes gene_type:complete